ncbi:unnamed protein product [Protopolystoma xenopodis]|uniref:Uncharacterized protein n=1 Tax=Protopolystoma xenopodis TaxID=117903 RepID=A0A448XJH8_9PLAT|nr:unnamed protein product [Protopolystoma xenopodis]
MKGVRTTAWSVQGSDECRSKGQTTLNLNKHDKSGELSELSLKSQINSSNHSAKAEDLGRSEGAFLDHSQLSLRCIGLLSRISNCCSARDIHGGIVRPLPLPRRALTHQDCLPHLVELLLTFDPALVEQIVSLLHTVVDQNPFLPRIYQTGVFYFVLMYTGSNVLPIANFLKKTHLVQAFLLDEVSSMSFLYMIFFNSSVWLN